MTALTLAEAELIGIILHSALYGIFVILFVGSIYVPLSRLRRRTAPPNRILMSVTIILFILITIHWILQLLRLIDAFIYYADDDGGPSAYYADGAGSKNVTKTAFYIVQTFVGDCTMVYRLYIVWGHNWRVTAGGGVLYSFTRLTPGENVFVSSSGHWVLTVFAATLGTNITVTSLISYRIWSVHRPLRGIAQYSLMVFCLIVTLTGYLSKENYQFISLDATSPVIGIAFALIIVRAVSGTRAPPPPTTSTDDSEVLRSITFRRSRSDRAHGILHHLGDETASHDDKTTPVVNLAHDPVSQNDDYT
ncbi:hypothetical protein BD779DRAFT_1508763 [Infundibulicybe gibba]|nr:hypothetical protein BD779DRAFT_1508763 [Infundibulicybe gibba]